MNILIVGIILRECRKRKIRIYSFTTTELVVGEEMVLKKKKEDIVLKTNKKSIFILLYPCESIQQVLRENKDIYAYTEIELFVKFICLLSVSTNSENEEHNMEKIIKILFKNKMTHVMTRVVKTELFKLKN